MSEGDDVIEAMVKEYRWSGDMRETLRAGLEVAGWNERLARMVLRGSLDGSSRDKLLLRAAYGTENADEGEG